MIRLLLCIFLVSITLSCNRSGEVEEGDRNTFTFKGTLYKGVSDEPYPNAPLRLELAYGLSFDNDFEVIARTTTDENGNFSLTYRKIKKIDPVLDLFMDTQGYTSGFSFLELPVNQNLERDVAEVNHVRLRLNFQFSSKEKPDTLYLTFQPS
ncbi:transthyretin-like family protein [Salibacteraceae bacterium]|nr:transthyretin-like family protein [Salibacteraceae bacterium]